MNWGWRITLFLTLFIGFILSMVIYSFGRTNDLVSDDYYNQEIQYQKNIDAQQNGLYLAKDITIQSSNEEINIAFPASFNPEIEKGDISFYRPDNAKLDRSFPMKLNKNNAQKIMKNDVVSGFYKITIQFIQDGKLHLINKEMWL